ncbi:SGNH/GDSL hydrolase family protein [Demequina phytophila]|uniref:hyaluronate lyase N-terminal domain-containing protein n=1 Tax=Demequina phytophila TaxID=1638981 RepID=UPI000785D357|nr:SGNH/GDSL hydrolase family protein [Demequina phytophila]
MTTIKLRRGTWAQWQAANPVLAAGEPGYETDTGKYRIGDGGTRFVLLPAFINDDSMTASYVAKRSAADIMRAGLATWESAPVAMVFAGSSTTANSAATGWVARFVTRVRSQYSTAGGETAIQVSTTADFTRRTAAGVHAYNCGIVNTRANDYLTDGMCDTIAAVRPAVMFHMVGSNDFSAQRNPTTYENDLVSRLNYLDGVLPSPVVHILVHAYQRLDVSSTTYAWSAYGNALRRVAGRAPASRLCLDLSGAYEASGIPGSDPLDLLSTDNVHQTAAGYAFMSSLIQRELAV